MKKLLLPVLVTGLILVGCQEEEKEVVQESSVVDVTVTVSDTEKVISEKELEVVEGSTLSEVMTENFEIEEEDGFVTAIEGVEQSPEEGMYWVFEVNNEMINEGADDFVVSEDDVIDWELMGF